MQLGKIKQKIKQGKIKMRKKSQAEKKMQNLAKLGKMSKIRQKGQY